MIADWLEDARHRDRDAVIEVEPDVAAPTPIARRRLRMFQRLGFTFPAGVDYRLPSGAPMLVGVRPRPSRRDELRGVELDKVLEEIRGTYIAVPTLRLLAGGVRPTVDGGDGLPVDGVEPDPLG